GRRRRGRRRGGRGGRVGGRRDGRNRSRRGGGARRGGGGGRVGRRLRRGRGVRSGGRGGGGPADVDRAAHPVELALGVGPFAVDAGVVEVVPGRGLVEVHHEGVGAGGEVVGLLDPGRPVLAPGHVVGRRDVVLALVLGVHEPAHRVAGVDFGHRHLGEVTGGVTLPVGVDVLLEARRHVVDDDAAVRGGGGAGHRQDAETGGHRGQKQQAGEFGGHGTSSERGGPSPSLRIRGRPIRGEIDHGP